MPVGGWCCRAARNAWSLGENRGQVVRSSRCRTVICDVDHVGAVAQVKPSGCESHRSLSRAVLWRPWLIFGGLGVLAPILAS
jgi:hypothetical protein